MLEHPSLTARWLEESLSLDEQGIQNALDGSRLLWMLNHIDLAAQLIVVPGALIVIYLRSRSHYELLRNTVLASEYAVAGHAQLVKGCRLRIASTSYANAGGILDVVGSRVTRGGASGGNGGNGLCEEVADPLEGGGLE